MPESHPMRYACHPMIYMELRKELMGDIWLDELNLQKLLEAQGLDVNQGEGAQLKLTVLVVLLVINDIVANAGSEEAFALGQADVWQHDDLVFSTFEAVPVINLFALDAIFCGLDRHRLTRFLIQRRRDVLKREPIQQMQRFINQALGALLQQQSGVY